MSFRLFLFFTLSVFFFLPACLPANTPQSTAAVPVRSETASREDQGQETSSAEAEFRIGTELTRKGLFAEAIPHFLAADGLVSDERVLRFNLALCYVGTSQFASGVHTLELLKTSGYDNENVENLLAQAYIGIGQSKNALEALQRAASFAPKSEKLYAFVADACADRQDFDLGLQVVELGLRNLPNSARLHYERGYFLVMLDHWDPAQPEFDLAATLAPHTDIAYLAQAQKSKFAGKPEDEIRIVRQAIQDGHANYLALTILGDALISSGAMPGQPEFEEAEAALTKAVAERPQFTGAQLSLGALLLSESRVDSAIQHLETAKSIAPRNVSVYAQLAVAYRKTGNKAAADAALAKLAELNAQLAERIRTAPGDRKAIMSGGGEHTSEPHR
jgi:tetratricopeptide (TPR) repeat protein